MLQILSTASRKLETDRSCFSAISASLTGKISFGEATILDCSRPGKSGIPKEYSMLKLLLGQRDGWKLGNHPGFARRFDLYLLLVFE
jgi:hypothetical protein